MQQQEAYYIGQQLGHYKLTRLLGHGGFAEVYLGENIDHPGELAAVKVLTSLHDTKNAARFQVEIVILRSLHHEHIVRILESGIQQGVPFLAMEYMPNGSLEYLPIPLPFTTTLMYTKAIASALQYAHDHDPQVTHCDVKPANMLLGKHGEIKLTDFNIALLDYHTNAPTLDAIVGTYKYMAPEQFRGRPSKRSDQYSLAVVVYEWLSGSPLFDGRTYEQLSNQHQYEEPVPLYRKNTTVLRSLSNVVMRALAKDEHQRYYNIRDFALALEQEIGKQMDMRTETGPAASTDSDVVPLSPYPRPSVAKPAVIEAQYTLMRDIQQLARTTNQTLRELEENCAAQKMEASQHERQEVQKIARTKDELIQNIDNLEQEVQQSSWYRWYRWWDILGTSISAPRFDAQTLAACQTQFSVTQQEMASLLQRASNLSGSYRSWLIGSGSASFVCGGIIATLLIAAHTDVLITLLWTLLFCILTPIAVPISVIGRDFYHFRNACTRLRRMPSYVNRVYARQERQLVRERERTQAAGDQEYTTKLQEYIDAVHQKQRPDIQRRLEEISQKIGASAMAWDAPSWQDWQPAVQGAEPIVRIGTFGLSIDERIRHLLDLPRMVLPALIGYKPGMNVLIETNGEHAEKQAVSAVETLLLRMLTTQPPHTLHFTVIDPSNWTNNLESFASQRNNEQRRLLGLDRTFIRREQAQQELHTLLDTIDMMMNGRTQYPTEEMPHYVLVLLDFPARLEPSDLDDILDIMRRGPRYGISTIIVNTFARSPSTYFTQESEHLITVTIVSNEAAFVWHDEQYQPWTFTFDTKETIPTALFDAVFNKVVMAVQPVTSCEHNTWFNELIQRRNTRPLPQPGEAGKLWLGHSLRTREPASVQLYRRQNHNLLIVGQSTEQETTLGVFTTAMIGLALQYPTPGSVRFLGIDLNPPVNTIYNRHPLTNLQQLFGAYLSADGVLLSESSEEQREHFGRLLDTITAVSTGAPVTSYVFISGLYRMNNSLLKRETQAMKDYLVQLKERLEYLYRYGYRHNVYLILACDAYEEFEEVFGANGIAFFGHRLVFRTLSEKASQALLNSNDAISLSEGQGCLYSLVPHIGAREHIYPYTLPSEKWLEWVAQELQHV